MARKASAGSKSAWFRKFFRENTNFIREGTNDEVLELWKRDHPGREPDESIRNVMSNVKSSVKAELATKGRGKKKKGGRKPAAEATAGNGAETNAAPPLAPARRQLEELEFAIDDVLMMAVRLKNPALVDAMKHLRRARNLVVWQQGQPS